MRRDSEGALESSSGRGCRCDGGRSAESSNVTEGAIEGGLSGGAVVSDSGGAMDSVVGGGGKWSLVVECCNLEGMRVGATRVASER